MVIMNSKIFTILGYLGCFCLLFLFEFATGWVRAFNVTIDVPCMFVKYALLFWFLISKKRMNSVKVLVCGISMIVLIPVLGYIVDGRISAFSLPNALSGTLGMVYGFIISKKGIKGAKALVPFIVTIFSLWYIFGKGFDHWCQLIDGDSFTGKTEPINVNFNWKVYNKHNDTFTSDAYKGKVAYLDFWSTSCGVCFIKFPKLEELYQKYKNEPNLIIQAVNIPIERDTTGMAFHMIERRGKYNFPVVIGTDSMREAFKVQFYPTVLILKDNKVVFRGRAELAEDALEDILTNKN